MKTALWVCDVKGSHMECRVWQTKSVLQMYLITSMKGTMSCTVALENVLSGYYLRLKTKNVLKGTLTLSVSHRGTT